MRQQGVDGGKGHTEWGQHWRNFHHKKCAQCQKADVIENFVGVVTHETFVFQLGWF